MIENLSNIFVNQLKGLDLTFNMVNIIEVSILIILLFFAYKKFIKNTQSEKLVNGVFILILGWILSEVLIKLNLEILGVFLKSLVMAITLSLIVIFQPELRKFLGYLGQQGFVNNLFFSKSPIEKEENINAVHEIVDAVKYLCKTKTGALIVLQNNSEITNYIEVGTKINADVSQELILTIFHPNTPLHDGAVLVKGNKIISAGLLLPLTEDPKLSWRYGTRHRAAIGMSEVSDCACLVVSEETGDVSIAIDGVLKKYEDIKLLRNDLELYFGVKPEAENEEISTVLNFIKIKNRNSDTLSDKAKNK